MLNQGKIYTNICAEPNFGSFNIYFHVINAFCRAIILPRHQIIFKEITEMSNNSNNKGVMTEKGREALERFKMESANELGINLKQGYNGDLTSREAGSIGGSMVKKMIDSYKMQ